MGGRARVSAVTIEAELTEAAWAHPSLRELLLRAARNIQQLRNEANARAIEAVELRITKRDGPKPGRYR